jgi:hypothetical protein
MPGLLTKPPRSLNTRDSELFDDFQYTMPSFWTSVLTDSGSATIGVGTLDTGAIVLVPSDGTVADNDEAYAYGLKVANLKSGAGFGAYWMVQYTEANTDDANIAFGLSKTAPIANFLVDDAGGVSNSANYDGFFFEKVDGGTTWNILTQWSGASYSKRTNTSVSTIFSGRALYGIEVTTNGLVATAVFKAWYSPLTGGTPQVLGETGAIIPVAMQHTFTFSSTTALLPVMAVKNGGANNESVAFDSFELRSLRA